MVFRLALVALLVAACTSKSPETKAPSVPATGAGPAPAAAPAAASNVLDEGQLVVTTAGQPAGEETFKIVADGANQMLTTTTVLRRGGNEVHVQGSLTTSAAARPEAGSFEHALGDEKRKLELLRKDGKLTLTVADAPPIEDKETSDLYVDSLVISHLGAFCRLAGDEEKDVKLFPGVNLRVSAKRMLEFTLAGGPKPIGVVAFRAPAGQVVEVYCDGEKLVLMRNSAAALTAVRKGFEEVASIVAEAEDTKPKLPAGLVELDRVVRSPADGGAALSCSLLLPADRRSPLPSVIFFTGSGPQDRDEDTIGFGGIKVALFKHLAIALAKSGIASLRCDDRGVGKSSGATASQTLATLVADGAAQIAALRGEPGLDARRIGLVGHSEGATVAQLLAAADPTLKALVLLAGMGRTLDEVSLDQRDAEMRKIGVKEEIIKQERKRMAAIYAAIRAGKPVPADTPAETREALAPILLYLQSHFRHDPAYTARKVKVPVLIAQGGKDFHVSPTKDARVLRDLLTRGGNKKVTLKAYPELSHMFAPVKTGTLSDYSDPELTVDLAFVGDVVTFLEANL